jgi:RND superfamily putative drug exporter
VPAGQQGTVDRLATAVADTPGIAYASPAVVDRAGTAALIVAYPTTDPQAAQTENLVHHLRDVVIPSATAGTGVQAYVGGETAGSVDAATYLSARLPWVIGTVLLLSFLLLMAVFRSLAIPVKAVVVNLLSVGAAYGVIVAVFQWGWLGGFFGIGATSPIDPWIPLMMFTILFGLSMDYEVFLITRIQEEYFKCGDNSTAVRNGLAATGKTITAAALIMILVFGAFILGGIRVIKEFGLGLAGGILVDAVIIRMAVVPSVMILLGKSNWWFPKWLEWLPHVTVDPDLPTGGHTDAPPAPADEEPVPV